MPRGGKRPGAGRPQGALAKVTKEARERALKTGEAPLDYMLRVMRDKATGDKRRDVMAQAAAPYVHKRLASTQHSSDPDQPMKFYVITGVPEKE